MKTFHVLDVAMLAACAQTENQPDTMAARDDAADADGRRS